MGTGNNQFQRHGNDWRRRVLDNYVIMPITINGSGTVTGIAVGGLPDGIVDADMLASSVSTGKILQVQEGTTTTWANTTNTSYTDSGLSVAITPSATGSKILIAYTGSSYSHKDSGSETKSHFKMTRTISSTETDIREFNHGSRHGDAGHSENWTSQTVMHLDSPSTTSACTYKLYYKRGNNAQGIGIAWNDHRSSLIALEIAA